MRTPTPSRGRRAGLSASGFTTLWTSQSSTGQSSTGLHHLSGRQPGCETSFQPPARGFTLIELLVVIVIISALVALLLPAIFAARTSVRNAQVQAEISRLGSALADFKAKHGVYPPSSITLYESGTVTDPGPGTGWNSDPSSMGLIRQIWGQQFDFTIDRDINNNGVAGEVLALTKGECLVFFLGGVPDTAANQFAPRGFSQNPANPFVIAGSNRDGPYFEFDVSRFGDADGDGMQEFRDHLPNQTAPYLYFSSYDGQGYLTSECAPAVDLTDVYRQGGTAAWNPQSFQIISPGGDGAYGQGGVFDPETADTTLVNRDLSMPPDGDTADPFEMREPERDNITSFHQGRLAPN